MAKYAKYQVLSASDDRANGLQIRDCDNIVKANRMAGQLRRYYTVVFIAQFAGIDNVSSKPFYDKIV